jgi:integrase
MEIYLSREKILSKDKIYLSKDNETKVWQIYYPNLNNPGKRTKMSTRTKNLNEANRILARFKEEYKWAKANSNIKSTSISEFAEIFKNYTKNTVVQKRNNDCKYELKELDKFLNYKVTLDRLTQQDIDNYKDSLFQKNYKASTIKEKFSRIFVALEYAKKSKYLPKETELEVPSMPKPPKVQKDFLDKEKLLKLLDNCKNEDLHDIITVAFMTGMRKSELKNLRWEQIDFEKMIITLDNKTHTTKTREIRVIPFIDDVDIIVKKRFITKTCDYVFTFNGKKWSDYIQVLFTALVAKTFGENSGITLHSLRHSFGSNLANAGVNDSIVQKLMGHANISTTMIYTHLSPDTLHKAVEKLSIRNLKTEYSKN